MRPPQNEVTVDCSAAWRRGRPPACHGSWPDGPNPTRRGPARRDQAGPFPHLTLFMHLVQVQYPMGNRKDETYDPIGGSKASDPATLPIGAGINAPGNTGFLAPPKKCACGSN